MKLRFSNIFNVLFRLIIIFFVIFVWIRYFVDSLILSVILTGLITLIVDLIINLLLNKKQYISNLKKDEQIKIETMKNSFIFNDETKTLQFFLKLVETKYKATKKTNFILIEHKDESSVILFPHFTFRKFNTDDLAFIINKTKRHSPTKIVICADSFEKDCYNLSKMFDIKLLLLDSEQTYVKLLKAYDFYPEEVIKLKSQTKQNIRQLFSNSISRSKTKGYLISSIIILFSSFIIKFNVYYLIMSTILLLLSFLSFISPYIKPKLPEDVL